MFDAHAHLGKSDIPSIICSSNTLEYKEIIAAGGSIGLLPNCLKDEEIFFKTLESYPLLNIGEVGLDKRYQNRDEQIAFFKKCLALNMERNSLLSIHCVKSDGTLLSLLKEYRQKRFIYHGFSGSYETANEIIRLGGIISLGLTSLKSKDFKKLITLPFLVESDREMGIEQEKVLSYVYNKIANELAISLTDLEKRIEQYVSICKA